MSLKIGDRVKSYDFILGDMLLNDKAYVVGDIVDIAPVDWCSDNCDHYHIKIFERFDAHGESIEVIGDMVYPPVHESMVVHAWLWPNDELEAESFPLYDYVTRKNRSCAWCGGTPKFMVYDLPTGPHAFCSEKHYARFVGMDEKPPGWYGYEAETGSESHDCAVCGTSIIILNDDYGTCPKCETFWNLVRLQDLWDSSDDDIKVLDAESLGKFYMVHRHDAKRAGLHYDLRLEDDGVLKSWAIPKGMPKSGKHLAIQTPDHDLSYGKWEGTIKSGYGAGDVKIDTSGTYKTLSKDAKKWKFEILSGKYKGVWTLTKWENDKWFIIRNKTFGANWSNIKVLGGLDEMKEMLGIKKSKKAENWGGDPEGPLAKALAKAREDSKKSKKPLQIEKLSAESSNQMFRREAILFGIGVVSAVVGTVLAEMLIDRYREDPELLDTPAPEQNA